MKTTLVLFVSFILLLSPSKPENKEERLFVFYENNLYGYIDVEGKEVIKPIFLSAGSFSEGLAAVRKSGTFGYINLKGEFVLQPQYDIAEPFIHGIAKVYINGKPFIINKNGEKLFDHNFIDIQDFGSKSFAVVQIDKDKYGIINKRGELITKNEFSDIGSFVKGVAVVIDRGEKGVIDSMGNWVVGVGKYESISTFDESGFAIVEFKNKPVHTDDEGVIDTEGNLIFTVPHKKWRFKYRNEGFNNGLASIRVYAVDPDTVKVWSSRDKNDYPGAVNSKGEIVFSNPSWEEMTPFANNRAFVKEKDNQWLLVNKKGKKVSKNTFKDIFYKEYGNNDINQLFVNGTALVKVENGIALIDTDGNIIAEQNKTYSSGNAERFGDFVKFGSYVVGEDKKNDFLFGFWDIKNNVLVKPQFGYLDVENFEMYGIAYVTKNKKGAYINKKGEIIWSQNEGKRNDSDRHLNIVCMNRGYFYAHSEYKEELAGYGGWGGSDNGPKIITSNHNFKKSAVNLLIDTLAQTTWGNYKGYTLNIANTRADTLYFDAQDSRLYMKLQAKDKTGNWRDIEYLPSSWCGNSYHKLFLAPGNYWQFSIPIYNGEYKTSVRAQLSGKRNAISDDDLLLYSNEVYMGVNPGQFWYKNDYNPNGIMDPYND